MTQPSVPVLGDVLHAAASRHPEREAYVDGEVRLTYGALDDAANAVATLLNAHGVRRGSVVCLLLPSGATFATAYLGAARAAAITSAVNLRLGPSERAHIVDRSQPTVTIAGADVDVPPGAGHVLRSSELEGAHVGSPAAVGAEPDDPVAIVWTSGTTGRPKGAVFDHVALSETSRGIGALTAPGDRRLFVVPFPHVGYMTRVWDDLAHGVTLVLPGEPWSAARTLELVGTEGITMLTGVPTQWTLLLDHPDAAHTDFSGLRIAGLGGASIAPELVHRMRRVLGCPVLARYTSTEAGLTTGTLPDDPADVTAETVGRAPPVIEVRVVGGDERPVAPGEVGEVRCRSRAMFRGYWRDPAATAAALDAAGFLRTGDLGFVGADGNLRLVGRRTEMYLRGGYNVYPVEVEAALAEHPAVAEVAVFGLPDPVLGEIGCACVVPEAGGGPPTLAEVRDWCRARIADYKAPDRLVVLDVLPVNAMMKVDKQVLAANVASETGGAHR